MRHQLHKKREVASGQFGGKVTANLRSQAIWSNRFSWTYSAKGVLQILKAGDVRRAKMFFLSALKASEVLNPSFEIRPMLQSISSLHVSEKGYPRIQQLGGLGHETPVRGLQHGKSSFLGLSRICGSCELLHLCQNGSSREIWWHILDACFQGFIAIIA